MTAEKPAGTLPDEDAFVIQPAWLRTRYARRGEPGLKSRKVDGDKARAVLAEFNSAAPSRVRRVLEHPKTDPEITAAGLAYHLEEPDPTPAGAAAVALAWHSVLNFEHAEKVPALADLWLTRHGLRFAVEAVVELFTMAVGEERGSSNWPLHYVAATPARFDAHKKALLDLAGRVRHALATAPDEEYREIVALLAAQREAGFLRRLATSFLAPTERAWVDADTVELVTAGADSHAQVLLTSVSTKEQVDRVVPMVEPWWMLYHAALLTSFLIGAGVHALPGLLSWLNTRPRSTRSGSCRRSARSRRTRPSRRCSTGWTSATCCRSCRQPPPGSRSGRSGC